MTDFEALIPEMREWNNGRGIDVDAWISCVGTYELAIGYSRIFWPRFVEYEDLVLREESFTPKSVQGFRSQPGATRASVEAVINHLHLVDLHMNVQEVTREQLVYLGRVLREIYQARLRMDFPERTFTVSFFEESEDLLDLELTFFQS